jgi:hypothetical protein
MKMNELLRKLITDTEIEFAGALKTPTELLQRHTANDAFADIAVLAGYSLHDILTGQVDDSDIDPAIINAFHEQYPHVGGFVDFIRRHSGDRKALAGIVSGIKGKLFETQYVDWLNHGHLPSGASAQLASSPTQKGWDIAIKDSNGHVINHLQLKATESLRYVKHALAIYPNIDVVATHEVFAHLDGTNWGEHIQISDFSNEDLAANVQGQIEVADVTPEFSLPLIAFGIIAAQTLVRSVRGQISPVEAVRTAFKRGYRSVICRGAAYAATLIVNEPVIGLPVSVLTRITFSRYDVQRELLTILDEYVHVMRERKQMLLSYRKAAWSTSRFS